MFFNPGTARDIKPRFTFNGDELEVVDQTKLLGIILRSDLTWSSQTTYMVNRAYKKLWMLRRLKKFGTKQNDLLDVYFKQVRSILEQAVQVWHPNLTSHARNRIERVQKSALSIIRERSYKSYNRGLKLLKLDTLFNRREKLCKKLAKKSVKSDKFSKWFKPKIRRFPTRGKSLKFCEVEGRLGRYKRSPISYLTNLLNNP